MNALHEEADATNGTRGNGEGDEKTAEPGACVGVKNSTILVGNLIEVCDAISGEQVGAT